MWRLTGVREMMKPGHGIENEGTGTTGREVGRLSIGQRLKHLRFTDLCRPIQKMVLKRQKWPLPTLNGAHIRLTRPLTRMSPHRLSRILPLKALAWSQIGTRPPVRRIPLDLYRPVRA